MTTQAVAVTQQGAALVEKVVIGGDLKDLTPVERVSYYRQVCDSLGLNYLTKPFDYITLNSKLTLYARKDATDQLRKRDGVSVTGLDAQIISDVYVVKAMARIGDRTDMATGAVSIKGLSGETLANAMLKAETKAKRRVTLSICGLGMLDESEAESVAGAQRVDVDMQTGEVKDTGAQPFSEYIKDQKALKGFYSWINKLGLSAEEVHAALNVKSLKDVTATVAQVKAAIQAYQKPATEPELFDDADAEQTGETA